MVNGTKTHRKNLMFKTILMKSIIVQIIKYGVKCGTSLRFWENNGWINKQDP